MSERSERGERGYRLVRRATLAVAPRVEDPVQHAAVAHTDGPLLVVGGPGTGKTSTLVEAVAARIAEGVDPERILVLTFGRRGAARLREQVETRLAALLTGERSGATGGRPGRSLVRTTAEPLVRTFHAYAFGLLRRAADLGEPPPRLLTGPEQDLIIRELVRAAPDEDPVGWPPGLRPALGTRAFAGQLRDLLLRTAERGIGPAELAAYGERLRRPDWVAAARFLEQYAQILALRDVTSRGSIAYDNAELVRAASVLLIDDAELLAAERRQLSYVYVDELADTDPAQIELLNLVAGGGKPLIAFADPDSSTYAFRGADPSVVWAFPDRFRTLAGASAPTVTLNRCYRTGAELLTATARVARRLRGPNAHRRLVPVEPPAAQPDQPAVEVRTFRSPTSEAAFVAHRLREARLVHGVPWSRMAVLVRSMARQLAGVQRALAQAEVPTVTHAEDLPLHAQPAVAPLLLLLRCALEPDRLDEDAAVALLHSPLGGADPMTERRLRQGLRAVALAAGDPRPSGVLLVEALRDPNELVMIERRWAAPARAIAKLLVTAREAAARPGATAEDVLWAIWRASGLAERWAGASLRSGSGRSGGGGGAGSVDAHRAAAADRDLDAVVALFDTAARFADRLPGARVEVFLDHVLSQQLPADSIAPTADRGEAVRILTAHAAKGQEWDFVAIVGVQEGVWPDLRLRGSLLGSETLVDVTAGRSAVGAAPIAAASQTAALLDEERRLFYVATTRARRRLLVTAVASGTTGEADGEEQPSRFLDELAPQDEPEQPDGPAGPDTPTGDEDHLPALPGARPPTRLPRQLTLPALVAELRTVVTDPTAGDDRRQSAAAQLARLAAAGVRGAHPDEWWGVRPLSDDRPLDPVPVSPSTVESALRCGLQWLLRRHGGDAPATAQQGIGNLVHAAAMLAADGDPSDLADRLAEYVGDRFDSIELSARWLGDRERGRADQMIAKLVDWLGANPRRLAAIEQGFDVELEDGIRMRGRVDRLEIDGDGRLVVVDLKTGSSKPTVAEVVEHPQLGAYQVAVEAGAFSDLLIEAQVAEVADPAAEDGDEAGGAVLVQLGDKAKAAGEQLQPPLGEATDPGWARKMVRRAADTMAAATFEAVANSSCRTCPVRTSCPVSGKGRQL